MKTLDVCPSIRLAVLFVSGIGVSSLLSAQQAPPPAVTPFAPIRINFRERPQVTAEPLRLRRTPKIDGVIGEGEWDAYYTVTDGPIRGTVYLNWDENFLYLAVKTLTPAGVVFDIDAGGDGWLRGADNLEIVAGAVNETGKPSLAVRLLDAANTKETPVWKDNPLDAGRIESASAPSGEGTIIELAVPRSLGSLVLRSGATLGVRADLIPPTPASAFIPTPAYEPHLLLDATLTETRAVAPAGVNPNLSLSDNKCVGGQTLFATMELLNQTETNLPVKSILWTGSGASYDALNTIREVVVPDLPGKKTLKLKYRTLLPANLPTGTYALNCTVEFEGGRQAVSSATFSVVEPLQVQMYGQPDPVAIVEKTRYTAIVDVFSAVPRGTGFNVELTGVPAGWELEGNKKRSGQIDREDAKTGVRFVFRVPNTTPAGDYPIEAVVTRQSRTWKAGYRARVVRASPLPSAPAPAPSVPSSVPLKPDTPKPGDPRELPSPTPDKTDIPKP